MFGTRKRLLGEGAHAEAVVVDARATGRQWDLLLRVRLDDGTTVDVRCRAGSARDIRRTWGFYAGEVVPVRFDPRRPLDVVVDEPALFAAREDQRRAEAEAAVEKAEQRWNETPERDV